MRRGLPPAAAFGGLMLMLVAIGTNLLFGGDASNATIPNAPAYRLCTHLDFFQMTPDIRIGTGPFARRRKLDSCVEMDESFWASVKKAGLFPVRGGWLDRERDILGLIIFLSANIRDMLQGASLHVDTAPGGDYVLNIIRRISVVEEGR